MVTRTTRISSYQLPLPHGRRPRLFDSCRRLNDDRGHRPAGLSMNAKSEILAEIKDQWYPVVSWGCVLLAGTRSAPPQA